MVYTKNKLDKRFVGGGLHHATKILDRVKDSHKYTSDLILLNTRVTTDTVRYPKSNRAR